jgi:hypothetical protein
VKFPLVDYAVIDSMRQMQQPGDDLVMRMAGLCAAQAPRAWAAILDIEPTDDFNPLAQAVHALKSLSLNFGAE